MTRPDLDAILAALGVANADHGGQRAAVVRAWQDGPHMAALRRLSPELVRRGLMPTPLEGDDPAFERVDHKDLTAAQADLVQKVRLTPAEERIVAEAAGLGFALGLPDVILVDDNGDPVANDDLT